MVLHQQVPHMQSLLDRLVHAANTIVGRLYHATGGDPAAMETTYPATIGPFLAASGRLGAQWYHLSAPHAGFAVAPAPTPPPEQLAASVRWAFGAPTETDTDTKPRNPFEALSQSTERHVYDANRDTVVLNANREKVMYARYASTTACAFCRLLATRDTLYSDKGVVTDPTTGKQKLVVVGRSGRPRGTRAMGTDYHDNCKCLAVPVRPGEVYHPPSYVDKWRDEYTVAYKDPDTHSFKDIVNHMRRQEYHADKLAGALGDAAMTVQTP
jgi:hypothetical protein